MQPDKNGLGQLGAADSARPIRRGQLGVANLATGHIRCEISDYYYYTVSPKKQDTKLLAITSLIIIGFSEFFH